VFVRAGATGGHFAELIGHCQHFAPAPHQAGVLQAFGESMALRRHCKCSQN
jgi:hypothetical protein